jgi:uncharacterized protein
MEYIFLLFLFIVAFLYSSVGHGGASGYLALMALFGISPLYMRASSLTMNVFVASIALVAFVRAGYFKSRLVYPFLVTSIPMAFLGASVHINNNVYEFILGIFLMFAVIRMLFIPGAVVEKSSHPPVGIALLIGAVLGFFSGMIGIGGGIILSPLLILMHWATIKESAAASALFILLNSLSGLAALWIQGARFESELFLWVSIGVAGAITGSYLGSTRLKEGKLKYIP